TRFSRDWSSDVCSSDLLDRDPVHGVALQVVGRRARLGRGGGRLDAAPQRNDLLGAPRAGRLRGRLTALEPRELVRQGEHDACARSEERRVGKEWGWRGG